MHRSTRPALCAALLATVAVGTGLATAAPATPAAAPVTPLARDAQPVVLTGAQLTGWSVPAAVGVAAPYPSGADTAQYFPGTDRFGVRSAHNGTILPVAQQGTVPVDEVAAYSWTASGWKEVPVQVDERFPHFLANARSDFGVYSGTDQELTYAWGPSAHSVGEESWKKFFGDCAARYLSADPQTQAADLASAAGKALTPGAGETVADYTGPKADPVSGLDDDDEVVLRYRDGGVQAPAGAPAPSGASEGRAVALVDPLDPTSQRYTYLFRKAGGSSFTHATSEVQMVRAANADTFLDRGSFAPSDQNDPERLGSSNTGYGANLPGTVCRADGTVAQSGDRFPVDAMTVTTPTYVLGASGRWMVRSMQIRDAAAPTTVTREVCTDAPAPEKKPKKNDPALPPVCTTVTEPAPAAYGPDLVDRWKGRAFQQSPDSTISVVGFEDEQVNWEANASLLGWRQGPVRAIREVWGADSGTNVTKTETYYRDADVYRYRVRVHPIPSDGLYTSWDYNKDVASTYYNLLKPEGVAVDGQNDDLGNVDSNPVSGEPAYFDAPDPTFDAVSAVDRPEQVAGKGSAGSLVYVFEFKGATSLTNAAAVPYYRDDACLDDGTGDDPVKRPWPGEASTDARVKAAYLQAAKDRGEAVSSYDELVCDPAAGKTPFQGAFGAHGIHFFATQDSDNATAGVPLTEVDGQQWRYSVPQLAPRNVLTEYAPNVVAPVQAVVTPY